jgi:hypothetical protein
MNNTFIPKIGEKVTIGPPADEEMDSRFIGQIGIVIRRTMHFPHLEPQDDLWTVEFPGGRRDAFFTEEMIRICD